MQVAKKWLFLFVVLLIVGCNTQLDTPIPEDENWTHHQLDNGLKYHLYPTDDDEISIRLMIHAGSMQESEEQKGYAHFVEHMAFNGSRNFTGNDVIKLFEKTGGSFGADINAFTGYQLTNYKMDLSDKEHLELAMTWMRDVADGIAFAPEQVEKEKGVILGEFRFSRPEDKSLFFKAYEASIEGTVLEHLDPLGTKESVQQATSEGLKGYYHKWYQPQNAELIIAGNISKDEIAKLIEAQFSSWKNRGDPAVEKQRATAVNNDSRSLPSGDKESPSLHFIIDRGQMAVRTVGDQKKNWLDDVAQQLINQRISAVFNDAALAVQHTGVYSQWIEYNRYAVGSIAFSAEQREVTETLFLETLSSLRDHGVSQNELDTIMAGYQSSLANLDSDWDKRKPVHIVDQKVFSIEQAMPMQSRETSRQALTSFIANVDLKGINKNIDDLLSSEVNWLQGYSAEESPEAMKQRLAQIPQVFSQEGIKPLALASVASELAQPSNEGEIVGRTQYDENMTVWQLSNGVEVWYQRDAKAGERAYMVYASQGGKAALKPDLFAASDVLIPASARSGLGEFSGAQLDSFFKKKDLLVIPFVDFTHHGIELSSKVAEIPLALNAIFNISTEINLEPRQLEAVKQEFYQDNSTFFNSPEGKWYKAINAGTYQLDSKHRFIMNSDLAGVTVEQTLEVHKQLFGHDRNNKLVIIADVEPEQLAPMLRKYIASITFSDSQTEELNLENGYIQAIEPQVQVAESSESGITLLTRLVNSQGMPKLGKDVFAEEVLQRIASARLLAEVRENRGLDYSPEVFPVTQDGELVSDWFVTAKVAEDDLDEVNQALGKMFNGLATSITEEEVTTAAKQLATAVKPINDDPGQRAWFYSRYLIHGYGIDALMDIDATANSITLKDIQQRADWSFGANTQKMVATLTPKP